MMFFATVGMRLEMEEKVMEKEMNTDQQTEITKGMHQ